MRMHYSGGMTIFTEDSKTTYASGYPLCCSGQRAIEVRRRGNQTNAVNMVTCRGCLKRLNIGNAAGKELAR